MGMGQEIALVVSPWHPLTRWVRSRAVCWLQTPDPPYRVLLELDRAE